MHPNEELIHRFYIAFSKRDWRTMQSCYHDNVVFRDPAFPSLNSKEAKAMWHMLAEAAQNFSLHYQDVSANETTGQCRWEADYDFSRTGRRVNNRINATFAFKDGKIIGHTDQFDLWRWSGMALGLPGKLLGWSPFIRRKIQQTAQKSLMKFIQNHPEYQN